MEHSMLVVTLSVMWLLIIVIGCAVFAMYRESIRRLKQAQRRFDSDHGLPKGTTFPLDGIADVNGAPLQRLMEHDNREKIVIFTALGCGACASLYPQIVPFQRQHPYLHIIWMMTGDKQQALDMMDGRQHEMTICLLEHEQLLQYTQRLPFVYYLSKEGAVKLKDVVNDMGFIVEMISER